MFSLFVESSTALIKADSKVVEFHHNWVIDLHHALSPLIKTSGLPAGVRVVFEAVRPRMHPNRADRALDMLIADK